MMESRSPLRPFRRVVVLFCVLVPIVLVDVTDALFTSKLLFDVVQSTVRASNGFDLVLPPLGGKRHLPSHLHASLILIPGALVKPEQYREVAQAIQAESNLAVWVAIPNILPVPNPLVVGMYVKDSLSRLKRLGYPGSTTFVGGHSLGGAFLPNIFDRDSVTVSQVDGLIHLGCILSRQAKDDPRINQLPHMVLAGDLDGLVRTSRVAEDYHRYVVEKARAKGWSDDDGALEESKLQHSVVLVPGMNHFGYISGVPPFMDDFRDLNGELPYDEAVQQVASTVAQFMDYHRLPRNVTDRAKTALLAKIDRTAEYIRPLLTAMKLEGSYHLATPCHLCEEEGVDCDGDCIEGSPWAAMVQREIAPEGVMYGDVKDEFHQSWWINPFSDPPFFHPSVSVEGVQSSAQSMVATPLTSNATVLSMETVSEPVYEKPDYYLFDAGFFSNAALEIRSKFNSRQAILKAAGKDVPYQSECRECSNINQRTIQWALEHAPPQVQQRYLERGSILTAGKDIEHSSGPEWIWSYLEFQRIDDRTIQVKSHSMSTAIDHPVPFSGGKLYCKLLSPFKALDWMYTDSLRPPSDGSRFYNEILLSPINFLKFAELQSKKRAKELADPFFLTKSFVKTGTETAKLVVELAELAMKSEPKARRRAK